MAHRICCPYQRSQETPDPPCRPPITLDGTLTLGFLPEDHPHGRKFHLSPVDFGILKSPRIADKIKLKMSKKSSRTLRKELDQIAVTYNQDAHVLTSNEVLDLAEGRYLGIDGTRDAEGTEAFSMSHATQRFGTLSSATEAHFSRPVVSSPSIYSRSASRVDEDPSQVIRAAGLRKAASAADMQGLMYREVLPRQLSTSTSVHSRPKSRQLSDPYMLQPEAEHSRHWSDSTESTIRRRLEQSAEDCLPGSASLSSNIYYTVCKERLFGTIVGKRELEHKEYV